jgi:acetyl-CoA acetyltransferase
VVEAVRTLYGRRDGVLSRWHPVDLSAEVLSWLLQRAGADAADVDDVVWACASQVGAQAADLGRRAVLAAGWPESVPAATVGSDGACSARAVHWAAQSVLAGSSGVVVAGGAEMTSLVPLGAALAQPNTGKPLGGRLAERYPAPGGFLPPGLAAERAAAARGLTRSRLDQWAAESGRRAARAQPARTPFIVVPGAAGTGPRGGGPGASVPGSGQARGSGRSSPAVRPGSGAPQPLDENVLPSLEVLGAPELPALYLEGGVVTAGNFCLEGDGAAAVLVAEERRARQLGLAVRARFVSFAVAGASPEVGPLAMAPATTAALLRASLRPGDVSRWHVLELSSAGVLAWADEVGVDLSTVNPEGGELAVTCPFGAAGAGLFANAVAGLHSGAGPGRYAGVCAVGDGGVATACILEAAE